MPISNPSGANPVSGVSTGGPEAMAQVLFGRSFGSKPHVVITPTHRNEVWVSDVYDDGSGFEWENANESKDVTVYWIADQE